VAVDERTFRQTVGQFVTGVTIVATEVEGTVRAMTANSFTSLSLDPPLVLFCLGKTTKAGQLISSIGGFSVNILRHDQQNLSRYFSGTWNDAQPPAFSFVTWEGGPRLEGCTAALGCQVHAIHDGGDHWIVVGRVIAAYRSPDNGRPLVFFGGRYTTLDEGRRS
jgi:3-hydroxy-9,10-secoandrosta-1,3,5(10)-triene-9,17-dione monooxygenase reductase component